MKKKLQDKSKFNILVVDDIARNIQIVGNILRKEGYQISFAQDGNIALERVANNKFDLILLDIMMPGLDGYKVCDILQENPNTCDIPIIFLTAKTDVDSTIEGFSHGAVDYITKPFNGTELLARVETHLSLRDSKNELAKLNASKDKFFSIIAHDLKNPIFAFNHVASLLNDDYDNLTEEEKKEFIKMLKDSSNNISELLENLLDWSRTQTGKIKFEPQDIEIYRIAQSNIGLAQMAADKKTIKMINNLNPKTNVYADNNMLNTVLRNLISNAIKFTPDNGEIRLEQTQEEGYFKFSVIDNGVGIAPHNLEKLFKIDTNVTEKGTNQESGTGLGLVLCKEFIEMHNGEIGVNSELGKGTEFYFTLPAVNNIIDEQ